MIDTHAHIDDPQYAEELTQYIEMQKNDGVEAILVPSVDKNSLQTVPQVCKLFPGYCYPAYGLHPEEVRDDYKEQLRSIRQAVKALDTTSPSSIVAIGEIGLDYHFDTTYKSEQQDALREQLSWALEYNLPVMIHSRDATEDCLRILSEYTSKGLQGVMHCFSGSNETAKRIIDMGLYLGIGGVITFKNCRLADNLHDIPIERLVLETDAPYMAPVPLRGKRNESRWMWYVVDKLTAVYNLTREEIDQITTYNARKLFRLTL